MAFMSSRAEKMYYPMSICFEYHLYFAVPRKMPSSNENCLFHADRVKFDILEKEIKRSKLIPRTCIHRLASAICSCRTELGRFKSGLFGQTAKFGHSLICFTFQILE